MAKPTTDDKDEADRDEADEAEGEASSHDEAESHEDAVDGDARLAADDAEGDATAQEGSDDAEEDGEEEQAAAQLGIQRYVLAAFFTSAILVAYIFGKLIHGLWAWAASKDWFHTSLSSLAAVPDENKATYATIAGALLSLVLLIRTYRRASVRTWADEVANELIKVKWPTRKEVSNSTVVVIAASAVATIYLALLDRLWSFVTDLFYGTGS